MPDISKARVLLTNDDGINALGLKTLEQILLPVAKEVFVIAPETEKSGSGHSLTLQRPLRIREITNHRFAVNGTPTDCVLLAINHILREQTPDIVISGINHGYNLADDVTYSGTIAAAMEAVIQGIPALALSIDYESNNYVHWLTIKNWMPKILKSLEGLCISSLTLLNINFPNIQSGLIDGIQVTKQGKNKIGDTIIEGKDPKNCSYFWIGSQKNCLNEVEKGTDLEAVKRKKISVTPLSINLTDNIELQNIESVFK